MESEVVTKLVHGEGPSKITMDTNKQIVSCGRDSTSIVFHNGGLEEDTYQFDIERISSVSDIVCYKSGDCYMVAVATNDHNVLSYSYCSGNINNDLFAESKFDTMLLRFTAAINTLDVSTDYTNLAAGSSDFLIKMVNLLDTTKVSTIDGHEAPVLCLKFDPLNNYLASSSCDGTLKIWSINDKVMIHSINIFPKTNDVMFVSTLCRLSWQPKSGQLLLVPSGNGTKVFERDSWKHVQTINETKDDKSDHVTCWSPCGRYFAVGSSDGFVSVWVWPQCTLVSKYNCDVGVISSLYWDVSGNSSSHPLLFSSSSGYIGSLPRHCVYPPAGNKRDDHDDDPLINDSLLMEGIPPDSIFDDMDHDFNDATAISTTTGTTATGTTATGTIATGTTATGTTATRTTGSKRYNEVTSVDDIVSPSKKYQRINEGYSDDDNESKLGSPQVSSTNHIKDSAAVITKHVVPTPEPQHYHEIFQPSATPSYLSNRFMVYNLVGVVRCHDDGTSPIVEVEFHDSSTHHPFSIPNHCGWSMGSLSSKALLLASESSEDEMSQLQCTVFNSWDHNKDWSLQLPKGESIEVVALGDEWVAVATNKNYVRLFSLGGSQREVISYVGQIVSLAGRGEHLIIVYQETPNSSLTVWILNVVERNQFCSPHYLPVSNNAKLEWIGFSECGIPVSYDTEGIVRILSHHYGSSWLPVLDCSQSLGQKGDHYFVIGMSHNPNELRVILCKGMDYPPVQPRPIMSTLPLFVPLCEPQTEKSNIESEYLEKIFLHAINVLPSPVDLLKPQMQLMALACRSNYEFRAFEVVNSMTVDQGLELSLQYASQSGHFRLARQISNLRERKLIEAETLEEEQQHQEQEERHYHETQCTRTTSKVRRTLLPVNNGKENSLSRNHDDDDDDDDEEEEEEEKELFDTEGRDSDANKKSESETEDNNNCQYDPVSTNDSEIVLSANTTNNKYMASPFSSPLTSKKPSNPFKMATPLSKQIQVDRRSSFLDKICREVQEEKEKEKEKEKQKKNKNKLKPSSSSITKSKTKKKSDTSTGTDKIAKFSFAKKN